MGVRRTVAVGTSLGLLLLLAGCAQPVALSDASAQQRAEAVEIAEAFEDAFFAKDLEKAGSYLTPDYPGGANLDAAQELTEIWRVTFSRFSSMDRVGTPDVVGDAIRVPIAGVTQDGLQAEGHHLLTMLKLEDRWAIDSIRVTFTRYDSAV